MNPDGHIYMDHPDNIPAEDKARLDGFLRGRAEADKLKEQLIAAKEAQLRELTEEADR